MTTTDLLIAGGGLGAMTVVRALRALGDDRRITVLAGESGVPYDRPPLSKQVLAGTMTPDEASLLQQGEALDVHLVPGVHASGLAQAQLEVSASDGSAWSAADIVVATGARVRELPIAARGSIAGVHYLRTMDDAVALRQEAMAGGRVVVVGAGFIGLEAAATMRGMGCEVTVLEAADVPLGRVLGGGVGDLIVDLHQRNGVPIVCGATVEAIRTEAGRVSGVELGDGSVLPADIVIVGIGVVPETEWLEGSGVHVDNGVVCDSSGATSRSHVWGVGDASRWPNSVTGLHVRVEQWQSALDQAQVVAANLAAARDPSVSPRLWDSVPYFWSDQYDEKIQFAGHPGDRSETVWREGRPVVLFGDERAVTGILVFSNPRLLARGRKLVAAHEDWDALRALVS